jgi:integrase
MSERNLLDKTGRRRSPAVTPGYRAGCAPANKGMRYPPDPPRAEEIIAVMRQAGESRHALRIRGLIVVLWRAGLRVSEGLMLTETDLDPTAGSVLVRCRLCRIRHKPCYVHTQSRRQRRQRTPHGDVLPSRYVDPVNDVNDVSFESDHAPAAVFPSPLP